VVLGEGAHPDPASELGPVIHEIRRSRRESAGDREAANNLGVVPRDHPQANGLEIVVIVIGTEDDPQDLTSQVEQLGRAGAVVFRSVTEAVTHISGRLGARALNPGPPVALDRFAQTPLAVINVGLESFYDSLLAQGAQAVQVDWRPPAAGNERLASLLARMRG